VVGTQKNKKMKSEGRGVGREQIPTEKENLRTFYRKRDLAVPQNLNLSTETTKGGKDI